MYIYICKTAPLGIGSTAPQATYLIWPTGHRQHCSTGATYPVGHGAASKGRTAYCDIDIYICKTAPLGMGSPAPQATCLIWPTKHWQHCSTGATYLMWPTGHRQRLHRRHIIPQTRYRLAMTLEARAAQHTALTTASKGCTTYSICICEKIVPLYVTEAVSPHGYEAHQGHSVWICPDRLWGSIAPYARSGY